MKNILFLSITISITALVSFVACKKDSTSSGTTTNAALPDVFKKFNTSVQVYVEGNTVVIKTNGLPDHKSPYFATSDARYEAYHGANANFQLNPNRIVEQSLTFKIPVSPAEAGTKAATPLGPIG